MAAPHVHIAIPAMDELHTLPLTLQDLEAQSFQAFDVYVCVNQPDAYWNSDLQLKICENNQALLQWLSNYSGVVLHVLDYSSPGKGWTGKKIGVGWARKVLFDHILQNFDDQDILISLDADTRLRKGYIESIMDHYAKMPQVPVISVPYYHPLTSQEANDRAILRYEFFMRSYAINLHRIRSPYAFTAIGSAIAMRLGALRKIGGITPVKSGEDFYLIQKFRKMAPISNYNSEMVYPAARFSNRVFFGTGPALIKGNEGHWESYPIYPKSLFEPIQEAYQLLPKLFTYDLHNDFIDFLVEQAGTDQLWQNIRNNVKDLPHFAQAFHEKADGLRILQYLRQRINRSISDEQNLYDNLISWIPGKIPSWFNPNKSFETLSVAQLNELRDILWQEETIWRKKEVQIK